MKVFRSVYVRILALLILSLGFSACGEDEPDMYGCPTGEYESADMGGNEN